MADIDKLEFTYANLIQYSCAHLKVLLKHFKLVQSGLKADLVKRLVKQCGTGEPDPKRQKVGESEQKQSSPSDVSLSKHEASKWKRVVCKEQRRFFWHNVETKQSTWQAPQAVIARWEDLVPQAVRESLCSLSATHIDEIKGFVIGKYTRKDIEKEDFVFETTRNSDTSGKVITVNRMYRLHVRHSCFSLSTSLLFVCRRAESSRVVSNSASFTKTRTWR